MFEAFIYITHLLDETNSNIQFIVSGQGNTGQSEAEPNIILYGSNQHAYYTEKIGSNKFVVWKRFVFKVSGLCLLQQLEYPCPSLKQTVKSNCFTHHVCS